MSYVAPRSRDRGLMGLGAAGDEQAPIEIGESAKADPILSTASVMASNIMLRMAGAPRSKRLEEMVSILNAGQPGLGTSARIDFLRRAAVLGPTKKDQAMFDAIRAALADALVAKVLSSARAAAGLGQTVAEVTGGTSTAVNDANALFCSYGAGVGAMVGGFAAQFGSGGSTAGSGISGSTSAAAIAGCGAGQLVIQGQIATQQAQLAQSTLAQTLAMQQVEDARFRRYALVGGGVLAVVGLGYMAMKKKSG